MSTLEIGVWIIAAELAVPTVLVGVREAVSKFHAYRKRRKYLAYRARRRAERKSLLEAYPQDPPGGQLRGAV